MVNRLSSTRFSSVETSGTADTDQRQPVQWFMIFDLTLSVPFSAVLWGISYFHPRKYGGNGGMLVRSHWYRYRYTHTNATRTRKIYTPPQLGYYMRLHQFSTCDLSWAQMGCQGKDADANSADFIVGTELMPCHQQPHDNCGFIILRPNFFPTILFPHQKP